MPRHLCFILLAMALMGTTAAQAESITFKVRMQYQMQLGLFEPDEDFVDLAGTFNGWGQDPLTPLSDADGDSVYEITLDGFQVGETIEFKFRYNGEWDGREEFPGVGGNRIHMVEWGPGLIEVWYNDLQPQVPDPGQLSWWNDTVFYEIFVRSFQDSDGDGIGDLQGLTERLDYLNDGDPATNDDLGITGIWLMPINDSPSYHGYDATDYRTINPDYGTMEDFQTFLEAAHARGIKVIVDYVMNHCSNQHPWFTAALQDDPVYRDWFRFSPSHPGYQGPWGQDVWHWSSTDWYYGLFWSGMPDLNYETPAVKDRMFDTATFWLDEVGVDGFRLDAILYIHENGDQLQNTQATYDFWQDFNAHIKAVEPGVLTVGEAWTNSGTVLNYVSDERLDICFEFDLAGSILGATNYTWAGFLGHKIMSVYSLYPYLQFATFLTNHDQDRAFTTLGEDEAKNRAAAGIYLSLPGVPFLYYGEEIGMTGSGAHENIRTPMQWSGDPQAGFTSATPWHPVNGNFSQRNVARQQLDPTSLWSHYRDMIHARQNSPALCRGEMLPLVRSDETVLAFLRRYQGETVLCVINTGAWTVSNLTLSGTAASLPAGDLQLMNLLDPTDTPTVTVTPDHEIQGLELGPQEVLWYRFQDLSPASDGDGPPPHQGLNLRGHPNPFNPSTTLRFTLAEAGTARLGIYDTAGRLVRVHNSDHLEAGVHTFVWDGKDESGRKVHSGLYLARLEAGPRSETTKLLLLK